jgi:inner membrane transporter RhtA
MASVDTTAPPPSLLSRAPSPGLVIGAIASVQFGAALATKIFSRVGPAGAVMLRLVAASVLLSVIWRPAVGARSRRDLLLAALFGLVLAGMNLAFYEALNRIPLGVCVTLEFVGPLAVAVAGSRKRLDFAWVALAAIGIVALTRGGTHGLNVLGVVFALSAGGMWGVYILVNARVGRTFKDGGGLTIAMCVAALLVLPYGIADGGSELLQPHVLLVGAAVGALSSAIPYAFEMEALRRIATHVFGVLMSLEPAVAALAGFLLIGQGLSARELVGVGFVIVASVGASLTSRRATIAV